MKRFIAVSVVVVLVAACGSGPGPTDFAEPPATTATPTTTVTTTTTTTTVPPVDPTAVLNRLRQYGYYVEPGAPITGLEAEGVVKAGADAGKALYVVSLNRPPGTDSNDFAGNILTALEGEGTVLVLTPQDSGWATNEYEDEQLSEALDAADDPSMHDADSLAAFVMALLAARDTLPEYLVQTLQITNDMALVMLNLDAQAVDPATFGLQLTALMATWIEVMEGLDPPDEALVYHSLLRQYIEVIAEHFGRLQEIDLESEVALQSWLLDLGAVAMSEGSAIGALGSELMLGALRSRPPSDGSDYMMSLLQAGLDIAELDRQMVIDFQWATSLEEFVAAIDEYAAGFEDVHLGLESTDPPVEAAELHRAVLESWAHLILALRRLQDAAINGDEEELAAVQTDIDRASSEGVILGIELNEFYIEVLSR